MKVCADTFAVTMFDLPTYLMQLHH